MQDLVPTINWNCSGCT